MNSENCEWPVFHIYLSRYPPDYHRVKIWADYFDDGHKCRWRSGRFSVSTTNYYDQYYRYSISKSTPHIWGNREIPSFSMIARYINLIVVSNFIIQSAYTRFNWIKSGHGGAFLIRDVNTIIKSKKNWKWKSRGFKENYDLLRYSSRRLNALDFFFNLRIRR